MCIKMAKMGHFRHLFSSYFRGSNPFFAVSAHERFFRLERRNSEPKNTRGGSLTLHGKKGRNIDVKKNRIAW